MLKFVALEPRARLTAVRADGWLPFIMVEPPLGGQRVPMVDKLVKFSGLVGSADGMLGDKEMESYGLPCQSSR